MSSLLYLEASICESLGRERPPRSNSYHGSHNPDKVALLTALLVSVFP